jgi:ketosteroid isomerase-like protein
MTGTRAAAARAFLGALDRNDAEGLAPWVAPGATWWVDTGLDRAAGVQGTDPGPDRPWPLHGTMPMEEKIELLRGLPSRFPSGCRQQVWHAFAGPDHVLAEVQGDGIHANGRHYENRYAFVFSFAGDRICEVREYLDTEHAADIFEGRHLDRRTVAPPQPGPAAEATNADEEAPLALVEAMAAFDPDAALALFADGATWWADSGRKRERARHDLPIDQAPRNPMYGRVPVAIRVPLIRGLAGLFTEHWSLMPTRIFTGEGNVCLEVSSEGRSGGPKRYQNRYCFVFAMRDHKIAAVREYCDTLHAFDVLRAG